MRARVRKRARGQGEGCGRGWLGRRHLSWVRVRVRVWVWVQGSLGCGHHLSLEGVCVDARRRLVVESGDSSALGRPEPAC